MCFRGTLHVQNEKGSAHLETYGSTIERSLRRTTNPGRHNISRALGLFPCVGGRYLRREPSCDAQAREVHGEHGDHSTRPERRRAWRGRRRSPRSESPGRFPPCIGRSPRSPGTTRMPPRVRPSPTRLPWIPPSGPLAFKRLPSALMSRHVPRGLVSARPSLKSSLRSPSSW